MFAWVLILVAWVAFLSLILHDVTKDETAGGAVLTAARKVRALIALAVIRFRKFRRARAKAIARARAEKHAVVTAAAAAGSLSPGPTTAEPVSAVPTSAEPVPAETVSPEIAPSTPIPSETSQPETPQRVAPEAIKLAPAQDPSAPRKKWWRSQDDRPAKTIPELESAIAEAVRSAAPDCGNFVGVIVRQKTPKSRQDVNWELQGVRFGKADKKLVNDALPGILKQMQQEFRVTDHH
jgi:hypothetical protein